MIILLSGTSFVTPRKTLSSDYAQAVIFKNEIDAIFFGETVEGFKGDIVRDYGLKTEKVLGEWPINRHENE